MTLGKVLNFSKCSFILFKTGMVVYKKVRKALSTEPSKLIMYAVHMPPYECYSHGHPSVQVAIMCALLTTKPPAHLLDSSVSPHPSIFYTLGPE